MPRDNKLLESRNKAILDKYKELYEVKRIRSDESIKRLSEMFFLSESTVSQILFKMKTKKKVIE
ncbi:MAG: hypothetical protein DI598_14055 [Pseudopedobacter saltans]|uniref:Uncharacterized protein n=1 Tax=Pseudopedobacter saltans TaxID=151895 RepID=A0A2W5EQT7_9SPHI|nr:MAG: hypothetical protein DI598_14055 [Pseudopedobacter saltans]